MDEIYFKVKELYDEIEQRGTQGEDESERANDDETFGWSLAEQWIPIGTVFLFLQSIYFFLEVNDEQNIYDSKGLKVGSLQVALNLKLFDSNKKTPLNMIDFEDMTDPSILNKWL